MIHLHVLSGKKAGSRAVAGRFPFRVGRAAQNHLALEDDGVWEQHLTLEFKKREGIQLAAAPNAIATVNGKQVENTVLRNGDIITLGSAKIQFWLAPVPQRGLRISENFVWVLLILITVSQLLLIYMLLR
jgi:pSer/pThr/pTyr-binding forkhead associated (FHA) protein